MQSEKTSPNLPTQAFPASGDDVADGRQADANLTSNDGDGQSVVTEQVVDQGGPVHLVEPQNSEWRNSKLNQSEKQVRQNVVMNTLADRLKSAREAKKMTKAELCRAAGIKSPSTLTELENGMAHHSPQLPQIAEALGVNANWLATGKGHRLPDLFVPPPEKKFSEEVLSLMEYVMTLDPRTRAKALHDLWNIVEELDRSKK